MEFSDANRFVEMVKFFKMNVMMEILIMAMDVILRVLYKVIGFVKMYLLSAIIWGLLSCPL